MGTSTVAICESLEVVKDIDVNGRGRIIIKNTENADDQKRKKSIHNLVRRHMDRNSFQ